MTRQLRLHELDGHDPSVPPELCQACAEDDRLDALAARLAMPSPVSSPTATQRRELLVAATRPPRPRIRPMVAA